MSVRLHACYVSPSIISAQNVKAKKFDFYEQTTAYEYAKMFHETIAYVI